jgi:hypothetical protein
MEPASVFNSLSSSQPQISMILSTVLSLYIDIPRIVHTLYIDSSCIRTLYTDSPCTHQKIGFFSNFENFIVMILDLPKLQCIHEILPISSLSKYIFNTCSRDPHHICSTRISHKKLSINTPKDILTRSSPLIHKKYILQETIFILFILSSSGSLNPFLCHLTYFPYFRVNHFP